jgi:hypothetical protein
VTGTVAFARRSIKPSSSRLFKVCVKIAQANFTAAQGIMTGTFTNRMPVAGGKPIAPTNKSFRLEMVTIGRWENGVMKEEWLTWDNQAFLKQIGLAKWPARPPAGAPVVQPGKQAAAEGFRGPQQLTTARVAIIGVQEPWIRKVSMRADSAAVC